MMKNKINLLLLMIQLNFAIILFISGFLPFKAPSNEMATDQDRPTVVGTTRLNSHVYSSKIDRIIIMVIDALRYDMIINDRKNMPFFDYWTQLGKHCIIKAKAEAPTVTLPRIKALMTGSVPGYIDVALNLKHYNVAEDNFLAQAINKGKRIVFYGDDTWLKLFPNYFVRSEGTHSFIVTDYTEVDLNVTKNVHKELSSYDWNVMILHYLGLDHIGHLESPRSSLVKPKLREMDNVVSKVYNYVLDREKHGENVVLLIGSDHGMKDSGGHGGSSMPEIFVPYIFLNYGCDINLRNEDISQIDITPLLSVLFGLPIPANSVGKLHSKMLNKLDPYFSLYVIHYNTIMLHKNYKKYNFNENVVLSKNISYSIEHLLKTAEILFESAIHNNFSGTEHILAFKYYDELQRKMSNSIVQQGTGYDMFAMLFALVLLLQILAHLFFKSTIIISKQRFLIFLMALGVVIMSIMYKPDVQYNSYSIYSSLSFVYVTYFLWNFCFEKPENFNLRLFPYRRNKYELHLIFSLMIYFIICGSTSFMEEEHNIWYYAFATFLLYAYTVEGLKGSLFLLILHPFLRCLNSTGVKFSNYKSIGDWFKNSNNGFWLILLYVTGLWLTASWIFKYINPLRNLHLQSLPTWAEKINKYLIVYLMTIILLLKFYSGTITPPPILSSFNKDNINPHTLWFCLLVGILIYTFWWYPVASYFFKTSVYARIMTRKVFVCYSLDILILHACLLYTIVCQPHNIVYLPFVLYYSVLFKEYWNGRCFALIMWHLALGMSCFYFQGNSLSLATIDVSAGYRTLLNPNMLIAGFLVYFNTMGLPIISTLCFFKNVYSLTGSRKEELYFLSTLALISTFYMIYYVIIIMFQRYHLFVWSVFAPKLLYTSVMVATLSTLIILVINVELFHLFLFYGE